MLCEIDFLFKNFVNRYRACFTCGVDY